MEFLFWESPNWIGCDEIVETYLVMIYLVAFENADGIDLWIICVDDLGLMHILILCSRVADNVIVAVDNAHCKGIST